MIINLLSQQLPSMVESYLYYNGTCNSFLRRDTIQRDVLSSDTPYEIYIPGVIDTDEANWKHNTWKEEIVDKLPLNCQNARPSPITIPVTKLSHVTHYNDAISILRSGANHNAGFPFSIKKGKASGTSYKEGPPGSGLFQQISQENTVLPSGMYSWWSVCLPDNYEPPQLLDAPFSLVGILSPCLATSHVSEYGSIAMTVDFDVLLMSYHQLMTESFKACSEITYKSGGTILYRKEISRIIIVCCKYRESVPDKLQHLPDYNFDGTVTITRPFQGVKYIPNGDNDACASFLLSQSSWDTYMFAFYHPLSLDSVPPLLPLSSHYVTLTRLTHYIMFRDGSLLPKNDHPITITGCHKNDSISKSHCPDYRFINFNQSLVNFSFDNLKLLLEEKTKEST